MRVGFLITFLGFALAIAPSFSTWAEDPRDFAYAIDHLQDVLEFERTGMELRWHNPETGKGGVILVERTYFTDPKTPCRDFTLTFEAGGAAPTKALGTGCRRAGGEWLLTDGPAPSSVSAIRRNWAPRGTAANRRPRDSSIHREPASERRPSDAASKEQRSDTQIQAATRGPSSDLRSQTPPDCTSDSGGEPSIKAKQLDLVILLDTTASMRREFRDIQADLLSSLEGLQRMVPSLNVGLVAYRDESEAYLTRTFQLAPMTGPNLRRLGMFIGRLEAEGGGDVPEAIGEALNVARGMAWRPTAPGQIVVISDAPAQEGVQGLTLDSAREFHASSPSGLVQRRVSAIYTGSSKRRNSITFYQRLAEIGGGCFTSHQGILIENALISVL